MTNTSTNPAPTPRHNPTDNTQPNHEKIRSPHHIPSQAVSSLLQQWSEISHRTFIAHHSPEMDVSPDDLFAELAYSARIAREITASRWCVVAELLRAGAVESWTDVATAMDITETEARSGFHAWITDQINLRRWSGTLGLTDTHARELSMLAQAVAQ
ncbi:hypothetical protein KIPE111705_07230 [Kibdelosporangium persicum]|uniref:Uncharacterized protein n=2 Tax=Kibdelosporangium persicum TaxID=2698649 RepID=A0ABX2FHF0_9PSEU|nr:hypothetical protein [Kibdelosporangium persicum]NRN70821.1 hypothetical protein [Kibdelosporangium persicum]